MKEWKVIINGYLIMRYETKVKTRTQKQAIDLALLKLGEARTESIESIYAHNITPDFERAANGAFSHNMSIEFFYILEIS